MAPFHHRSLRNQSQMRFHFKKTDWLQPSIRRQPRESKTTNQFSALSQKFTEYGIFSGRGDSTKILSN
jgi:hypothetical protein